ncbi:hypothetical protein ACA097_19475 [Pseudomonas sp. QL9]|uniref:hypothetical protein n=1 Tax=Pseudomonas sp. QL9 TaxID=3242725 RepID=UPI003529DFC7
MRDHSIALATALVFSLALGPAMAADKRPAKAEEQAQAQAPNPAEFDKQLEQIQKQLATMQEQMQKFQGTQDPKERQKLLDEHWVSMQSAMASMHSLWGPGMMGYGGMGPGMMGGGMMGPGMMGGGWGHMRGYYSNLTPEQIRQRQYMMDQYLNMQQMMMNNMMWNQQYRGSAPTPNP